MTGESHNSPPADGATGHIGPVRIHVKGDWCTVQVEKVYLVEQRAPTEKVNFWLNLDQVWVLDRSSKRLDRAPVLWNEHITDAFDYTKLILRIRCAWALNYVQPRAAEWNRLCHPILEPESLFLHIAERMASSWTSWRTCLTPRSLS